MLTLSEFSSLARELNRLEYPDLTEQLEVILRYTDLSSEDEEHREELDREIFSKIKTE